MWVVCLQIQPFRKYTTIWLATLLAIYQVQDENKFFNMASFSQLTKVSEEELNAFILKAVLEKTKIATKGKNEFEVSIWQFH